MLSISRATRVALPGQACVPAPVSVLLTPVPSTIFYTLLTSGGAHAR